MTSNLRLGAKRTIKGTTQGSLDVHPDSLLTHAVIVGMTGSGKTGLMTVMIEEALRAGIPVLIIDPKGDLANIKLAFPTFDPEPMTPWIDAAPGDEDGIADRPLVEAAAQKRQRELAGWEIHEEDVRAFAEQTHIRVITPGTDAGEPLHLLSALERRSKLWDDDLEGRAPRCRRPSRRCCWGSMDESAAPPAERGGEVVALAATTLTSTDHLCYAEGTQVTWETWAPQAMPWVGGPIATDGHRCCTLTDSALRCVSPREPVTEVALNEEILPGRLYYGTRFGDFNIVGPAGVTMVETGNALTPVSAPTVSQLSTVPSRSAVGGYRSGCAVGGDGALHCWGDPGYLLPDLGEVPGGIMEIVGIGSNTCVLDLIGDVYCWGRNVVGFQEETHESTVNWEVATRLPLEDAATHVAVGLAHGCAVLRNGTVWCWGSNYYGQLGDGTRRDSLVPVRVRGLSDD